MKKIKEKQFYMKEWNKKSHWVQVFASKLLVDWSGSTKMPNWCFGKGLQVENGRREHDHLILHIQTSLSIKFQLKLTIVPKKDIPGLKQKKWTAPFNLHIRISVGTKLQLSLTIMILRIEVAQKRYLWFKTEKVNMTIEFCIFELFLVPCQLKLTILIFWSKFVQKGYFRSIAL